MSQTSHLELAGLAVVTWLTLKFLAPSMQAASSSISSETLAWAASSEVPGTSYSLAARELLEPTVELVEETQQLPLTRRH